MSDDKKIMKTLNGYTVYDEDAHRRIDSLAGSAPGLVFETVADMEAYVAEHHAELKVGQNLYIREVDVPDYWWDGTAAQELEVKVDLSSYAKQEAVERLSKEIADLKGDITTVKDTAELEIIDETVDTATLSGGVLRFGTFVNRFAAVIVPDAVQIKVGVSENTEVYPDFQNANGALNDVGWWLLRKADGSGFIAVNPSIPDVYFIAEENNIGAIGSWSAISGAITSRAVGENYLRVELTGGKAIVYVDDAVVYTVDGIDAIGYASEHNKATTVYDVSVSFIGTCECETPATNGSGLTAAQISALDGMFKAAAYTKDITAEYTAFKAAFGIEDSGEVEPDEPVEPEVTLTSISATYGGGDVAVGTALTDLTGIVVTATYSDGSTAAVTGYTLSGEIAEGTNTITVSYSGMTATFTVTGVAESGGDTENNGWTDGESYNLNWTDGYYLTSTGAPANISGFSVTEFVPCAGVTNIILCKRANNNDQYNYFYDKERNKISGFSFANNTYSTIEVPENAAFFRISVRTEAKDTVIVSPNTADLDRDVGTDWTDGVAYTPTWTDRTFINGSNTGSHPNYSASGFMGCNGASTISFAPDIETKYEYNAFYDVNHMYISSFTVSASNNWTVTVPQTAAFVKVTKNTSAEDPVITPHA